MPIPRGRRDLSKPANKGTIKEETNRFHCIKSKVKEPIGSKIKDKMGQIFASLKNKFKI